MEAIELVQMCAICMFLRASLLHPKDVIVAKDAMYTGDEDALLQVIGLKMRTSKNTLSKHYKII